MYRHRHIHRVRISFRFAFCENGNEKTDEKRSFIAHFTFLLRHFQRVIVLSVGLWLPFVCSSPQIGKSIENSLSELERRSVDTLKWRQTFCYDNEFYDK